MQVKFSNIQTLPQVLTQEYIPLKIQFNKIQEYHCCVEFAVSNHSMLEIMIGTDTKRVSEITLINCKKYYVKNDNLPEFDIMPGCVTINEAIGEADIYKKVKLIDTTVYSNGLEILLSDKSPDKYIKDGLVVWYISDDKLIGFSVRLTPEEVSHSINELNLQ